MKNKREKQFILFPLVWIICYTATGSRNYFPLTTTRIWIIPRMLILCWFPYLLTNTFTVFWWNFLPCLYIVYIFLNALTMLCFTLMTARCWHDIWLSAQRLDQSLRPALSALAECHWSTNFTANCPHGWSAISANNGTFTNKPFM